jgi:transposase
VKRFLEQLPNVKLHFTPTYSSWLNQVESWFSKLKRDVIDRGIFTSVADLRRRSCVTSGSTRKRANPFSGIFRCHQAHSRVVAMAQGQPN